MYKNPFHLEFFLTTHHFVAKGMPLTYCVIALIRRKKNT